MLKWADAGEIILPAADTVAGMFTKTLHPFMPDRLNEPNGYSSLCEAAFQVMLPPSEFQGMKILITYSLYEQPVFILFQIYHQIVLFLLSFNLFGFILAKEIVDKLANLKMTHKYQGLFSVWFLATT